MECAIPWSLNRVVGSTLFKPVRILQVWIKPPFHLLFCSGVIPNSLQFPVHHLQYLPVPLKYGVHTVVKYSSTGLGLTCDMQMLGNVGPVPLLHSYVQLP